MTTLIKNDDGSYSYGSWAVLAPVYDRTTKKHIFNILRNGCVPIRHEGNHLTLRNSIKKLTEGIEPSERTETYSLGELLGIKPEPCTSEELLNAVTPVYPAANILTNEELGLTSIFDETEQAIRQVLSDETSDPLLLALRAVIADPENQALYGAFRAYLDEELESAKVVEEEPLEFDEAHQLLCDDIAYEL